MSAVLAEFYPIFDGRAPAAVISDRPGPNLRLIGSRKEPSSDDADIRDIRAAVQEASY